MEYSYVGYTEDKGIIKGRLSAASERLAEDTLANIGYRVLSLKPITPFAPNLGTFLQPQVKTAELMTFSRQLALLVESGVGLVHALELLQSQTSDKQLKKVLIEVVSALRGGSSLSAAMSKHPNVFSTIFHRMIGVGEHTGSLEGILRSLADYIERQTTTRNKLKAALTYPAIVVSLAVVIVIMMVTFVLPPLVNLVASLGGELPVTTKMLLAAVNYASKYGLYTLVGLFGVGLVVYLATRTTRGRYYLDMLLLKLPILGRVLLLSELARDCRNIALLFKAGLPLPEIMTLTGQASGNMVVTRALSAVEGDMIKGEGLAGPMRKRPIFLPMMVEMTKVGEETGALDSTLVTVAETFEVEVDRRVQALLSMLEPAMTIALGIGVAFVA
ncbi:MAG: type II secretion system F family protein, partial [Chloroflexi bacterium]|nr:type II secretion system F family protein [Chloroflexota bacterium]